MKLENLTEEHLLEVIKLYEMCCGSWRNFRDTMYQNPLAVLQHLREVGREEYRIGSRWDGHSKIYFETDREGNISIRFNPNFERAKRGGIDYYKDAERAGKSFVTDAMKYLEVNTK